MPNQRHDGRPGPVASRCSHLDHARVMVEIGGPRGYHLQRFSCGLCEQGWWERDGDVIELRDALGLMATTGRSRRAKRVAPLPL
jgi:hypothetical protein